MRIPRRSGESRDRDSRRELLTKGIPTLYGVDAIHGATYTSGYLGSAKSHWRPHGTPPWFGNGRRNRSRNPHVAFHGISPRCWTWDEIPDGHAFETFGEDVKLVGDMGEAMVRGFQEGPVKVAATLKHYLGYSTPWVERTTPAYIPERQLREIFLPPFAQAVEAGTMTVMVNSGEMNGIPTRNRFVLTDLLRGELGFEGLAVTIGKTSSTW